jgi:hypothetical protein
MAFLFDQTATIANDTDVSNDIVTGGYSIVGFVFVGTYTNTAFTLEQKFGTDYRAVLDDLGSPVSIPVEAGVVGALPSIAYRLSGTFRLKAAGNEGAQRTVKVLTREL